MGCGCNANKYKITEPDVPLRDNTLPTTNQAAVDVLRRNINMPTLSKSDPTKKSKYQESVTARQNQVSARQAKVRQARQTQVRARQAQARAQVQAKVRQARQTQASARQVLVGRRRRRMRIR